MKNKTIFYLLFFFAFAQNVFSQTFIDTVYSATWGEKGLNWGRSPEYFPQNIFGPPTKNATKYIPASSEEDVVSLGLSGEIIVGTKNFYVVDKEGPDFIIFENVFSTPNGNKIFVEPAIISVSQDGINFVEFPYNPHTLEGLAGINWTNGDADYFDYTVSGGDAFDLSTVGLDSITHIKIKDTSLIANTLPTSHKYWSPASLLNGFDLDAVVLLHIEPIYSTVIDNDFHIKISEQNNIIIISATQKTNIKIYDILGNELVNRSDTELLLLDKLKFKNGIYFLVAANNSKTESHKIIIIN